MKPLYKRLVLKLSGEALLGDQKFGVEPKACRKIAASIKEVRDLGVQVGVVLGGGNIFRGAQAEELGFARTPADHIGMLATTINGIALQQALFSLGAQCHILSALNCDSMVETYTWPKAMEYLAQGSIVIFVGGTGNPYFSTDTAAALRASEIEAEVVLKATKVDGIYDKDPRRYSSAKKFLHLSYADVFTKKLNVMDATAVALCRENNIPIHVFNFFKKGALMNAVCHKKGGSLVTGG